MKALGGTPRLFDCFLFFRELDILEIRLTELWDRVHRFVLIESEMDFAGNAKPLYFAENRERFAAFADKIEHIVVQDGPADPGARFAVQHHQRDQALRGLGEAGPNDLTMISDVDEIPKVERLETACEAVSGGTAFALFRMPHHSMRLNLIHPGKIITGPRLVRARDFGRPHLVRRLKNAYWKSAPGWLDQIPTRFNAWRACGRPLARATIEDGGWHLSSVGTADFLDAKHRAFADDEIGMAENRTNAVLAEVEAARASVAETFDLHRVSVESLPQTVARDPARWAHIIE